MSTTTSGSWLNQYVAPQLLAEFRNYKDDFMGVLGAAPQAALTADGIRFNKLVNNVDFVVGNTSGFTATAMTGTRTLVEWEKYDTTPTKVDDKEIRYLAYDKRNIVRVKHAESFRIGIRNHVLNKLAPSANAVGMPVIRTTGTADASGRKRLTFADLANYAETLKLLNLPMTDMMYMVLCPAHVTDLILDQDSAKLFMDRSSWVDPVTGKVKSILGFKFFENNDCPIYDSTGAKKAVGAVAATGDQQASVFFYGPNTIYHLDQVKILYKPETIDTVNADPTSEFRTQTYGLVDRIVDYGFGAIISANAE